MPNVPPRTNVPPRIEEFQVTGEKLLEAVKKLVHEGNIRRITIRNAKGITLLEIPLVVGLAGALLLPVWAAVGALAALVADCTLVVERVGEAGSGAPPAKKPPAQSARSTRNMKQP